MIDTVEVSAACPKQQLLSYILSRLAEFFKVFAESLGREVLPDRRQSRQDWGDNSWLLLESDWLLGQLMDRRYVLYDDPLVMSDDYWRYQRLSREVQSALGHLRNVVEDPFLCIRKAQRSLEACVDIVEQWHAACQMRNPGPTVPDPSWRNVWGALVEAADEGLSRERYDRRKSWLHASMEDLDRAAGDLQQSTNRCNVFDREVVSKAERLCMSSRKLYLVYSFVRFELNVVSEADFVALEDLESRIGGLHRDALERLKDLQKKLEQLRDASAASGPATSGVWELDVILPKLIRSVEHRDREFGKLSRREAKHAALA